MTDAQIRSHILDELAFEPSLDAEHLGVSVVDGIVTLTGQVRTLAEKRAAESAVARVRGVRGIAEEIAVVPPSGRCAGDEDIARRVLCLIDWDVHLPKGSVKVTVENGWVTLSGDLDTYFQRRAIEDTVHKLDCITGITNLINMRPDAGAKDIEARIRAVFGCNSRLAAHDIHVEAFGGMVKLNGSVNCVQASKLAERAAWGVPGVQWVENRLQVEPRIAREQHA